VSQKIEKLDAWEDFRYTYVETGWFNPHRQKTLEAMHRFYEKVSQSDLDKLEEHSVIVFAPSPAYLGQVMPGPVAFDAVVFVYLAPGLEKKNQAEVDFTVAHEFAHVLLGHFDWRRKRQARAGINA
jgi:uncharacterized protein YjaZ